MGPTLLGSRSLGRSGEARVQGPGRRVETGFRSKVHTESEKTRILSSVDKGKVRGLSRSSSPPGTLVPRLPFSSPKRSLDRKLRSERMVNIALEDLESTERTFYLYFPYQS